MTIARIWTTDSLEGPVTVRAMRWSNLFVPTLRDAPGDAEAISHKLLVRGGFIRQLHAGHYNMLPLGWRVHEKGPTSSAKR